MASSSDFTARGKVLRMDGGSVIFAPANTNYELKLSTSVKYEGPLNVVVDVYVRGKSRKLWTVSSGGNFVSPIHGPPRIVQGHIKYLDEKLMVLQAGFPFHVEIPMNDDCCDLNAGVLSVGTLVNSTLMPGASLEFAAVAAGT
jgi:hypothetical protein